MLIQDISKTPFRGQSRQFVQQPGQAKPQHPVTQTPTTYQPPRDISVLKQADGRKSGAIISKPAHDIHERVRPAATLKRTMPHPMRSDNVVLPQSKGYPALLITVYVVAFISLLMVGFVFYRMQTGL